ncbi:MAG: hypothetical protein HZB59_04715 [Ignavibacteriales bacterium]|nr:hypothetical protein [Ignavibacteriales bacterium]
MKHKFISLSIILLYFTALSIAQQPDSSREKAHFEFAPSLKSIQVDGSIILLAYDYGGSVDIDFLKFTGKNNSSLGTRLGIEYLSSGDFGGGRKSYLDYNLLVRHTVSGSQFRFDAIGGYAYQTRQEISHQSGFKIGLELRWKIAPSVFGMLVKWNKIVLFHGFVGVGLYLGYDR